MTQKPKNYLASLPTSIFQMSRANSVEGEKANDSILLAMVVRTKSLR